MVDYHRLRNRITELKQSGKSYAAIADQLNREDFQPANQAHEFNKAIVGRLAKKVSRELTATKGFPLLPTEPNEWTLKALATRLGIPRSTLHNWTQRGWVHVSRQQPGQRGTIVCWADPAELERLQRLRQTPWHYGDLPLPNALTTPNPSKTGLNCPSCRKQSGC